MADMKMVAICNALFRIFAILGAVALAINGIKGWGWFLFAAIIAGLSYNEKEVNND